ncbi:MAG TPA: glycoside hydrolase family 2 TIM barrel-domain containing protein [Chthonomonadaceae bacterium]|nr:glycoside hydrolase family 2 TIM barrel-domain containing protein [Chthonomonadaceae bacterium]
MSFEKTAGVPRPEYPRPQFVRKDWLNLNGEWEFALDAYDQGLRRGWDRDQSGFKRKIVVPFAYQTKLSGIDDQQIYQVAWYARDVEIPAEWQGRDILLHFGAVDYKTTVWINGYEVGHNQGGHVPFSLDISPYLREGNNRLVVRAEDPQDAYQPRGKQAVSGRPRGCDYYCTTGIWQTVWLEPAPPTRIEELRLKPILNVDNGDALEVRVLLHAPSIGWEVEAEALDGERVVAQTSRENVGAAPRLLLRIPNPRRWTPDTPHLYGLRVRLRKNGELLDEIESYFGLREVQLRDGRLLLNGEPVYLKMVLDQGYWPDGGMTAPSDAALRADVEWCKRFGFNGARKHQKVEDPRWLYWCDRLGLLVWGEMPNARAWSPRAEEMFLAEWERAVRRDINSPSVIVWVPVNESWGVPDLREDHPGQYAFLERVVAMTRRMDPDRPVIDNDGWEHTDVTDIVAIHDYTATGEKLRARYAETLAGGLLPSLVWGGSSTRHFARGSGHRGQPIVLSEVGGFLMQPDLPKEQWDGLYNIYGSCRTPEELLAQYRDLMEGIADLKFACGFCYTQLTDIEQESNGLLTYDRRPKAPPEEIAAIHKQMFAPG